MNENELKTPLTCSSTGETSVHEMLESLRHLGINYAESCMYKPFTKFHKINLEIHWTTIERQVDDRLHSERGLYTQDSRKNDSLSKTVYWLTGMGLYDELVKASEDANVAVSEWTNLSYGTITYVQPKEINFDAQKQEHEYTEQKIDRAGLQHLQDSIEQNPIPCTLKLDITPRYKRVKVNSGDVPF